MEKPAHKPFVKKWWIKTIEAAHPDILPAVIKFFIKHWDKILVGILILAYSIVFSTLSIGRHDAFASGFDLGNMDSTVWNTLQGRIFMLSGDGGMASRFSIHADLILALLSPLYIFWNDVRMLLITQSALLAVGAIPVYLLAQKVLKSKQLSIAMVVLYLLNPGMQWTNMYDFHPISLAIPFLLFAFYFAYTKSWKWYALFAILAILTKEQVSLTISLMGIFILIFHKERKVGLISFVGGIVWTFGIMFVVMPLFSPEGRHWAWSWFQFSSTSSGGSLITVTNKILERVVFSPDLSPYYIGLLKPFTYLPLLGLPWLIFALPDLAINVLSSHGQMRSFVLHYDSGITPWLTVASIFGLSYTRWILVRMKLVSRYAKHITTLVVAVVMLFALRFNYHYSPLPTTPSCWCFMYEPTKEDRAFEKLLQSIPQSASVTASPEIRPHTTHRAQAFTLPDATSSADFIAIIDQNRMVGNYDPKDFELRLMETLNAEKKYDLVQQIGHFYLYQRRGPMR